MAGKDKKPEIRFIGFADVWEQRKLGEVTDSYSGGTPSVGNKRYYEGDIPFIRSGEINAESTELFITEEGLQNSSAKLVKKGDILYALYGATSGEVGISHINGAINQAILAIKPKYNYDSYFIAQWLRKEKETIVNTYLQGGQGNLSGNIVKELVINIPSNDEEQNKIAVFFIHLDHLITLYQRKYDKLVIVKKSMLEKMFPKDGANVPEIRFKGFTGVWEQNKLNYYIETSNEKNVSNSFTKDDVLSVSGDFGIVNQIEFQGRSFAGASVSNYGIVDNGYVVYTKSPLKANPYGIIKTNKGKPGIVSTLYAVYKPKKNVNSNFVQCYFDYDYRLNKYLKPLVNKGAKNDMKVSDDNALTGLVIFPSYEEQTRIAEFLECIDNLISLHQRELEKLKNIKKSMLEKMFV